MSDPDRLTGSVQRLTQVPVVLPITAAYKRRKLGSYRRLRGHVGGSLHSNDRRRPLRPTPRVWIFSQQFFTFLAVENFHDFADVLGLAAVGYQEGIGGVHHYEIFNANEGYWL